jgi:exodeoxyribonuclease VII large subunit
MDNDEQLKHIIVSGELSNYRVYNSGHHYFTLKDAEATLRCVLFKGQASKLKFQPRDGLKVILNGRVTVFTRDGGYQLYTAEMIPEGIGDLALAFEQLKDRLFKEGLFDRQHKKPLPPYPRKAALITSPSGAVVRDMIQIMGRRWPLCKILICPVRVQGEEAPGEIAEMLAIVNRLRAADLIIMGRGGGSLEDLWAFSDERVVRAVFASRIPVVSAVGHEPDVTIADFTADVRASTPSHAAELVTPDIDELSLKLLKTIPRLADAIRRRISWERERLNALCSKRVLQEPSHYVSDRRLHLDMRLHRLQSSARAVLHRDKTRFSSLTAQLDAMSPLRVMSRGYGIAVDDKGKTLRSVKHINISDRFKLKLCDGQLNCTVNGVESNDK